MFDAAFANIAVAFSAMAGGPFVAAVATWPGTATYDTGGSITVPGTAAPYNCQVQFDTPTEAMRAEADFLQVDARLLILAASITRELDTDAAISVAGGMNGGTWALLSCQRDPAGVGYECRGRRVSAIPSAPPVADEFAPDASDGLGVSGGRLRVDIEELPGI